MTTCLYPTVKFGEKAKHGVKIHRQHDDDPLSFFKTYIERTDNFQSNGFICLFLVIKMYGMFSLSFSFLFVDCISWDLMFRKISIHSNLATQLFILIICLFSKKTRKKAESYSNFRQDFGKSRHYASHMCRSTEEGNF